MIERIQNPAIAYTASRLDKYARAHDIDTSRPFMPAPNAFDTNLGAGARSFRHGYAVPPIFETTESIPRTVPIVLARLTMYDARLSAPDSIWEFDEKFGIRSDGVSWLRLVQVKPDDERVGEILSIVGANYKKGIKGTELDQRGNLVPFTKHYYLESDQYAVKVAQLAPEQHLGLPVTSIGFSLPNRLAEPE